MDQGEHRMSEAEIQARIDNLTWRLNQLERGRAGVASYHGQTRVGQSLLIQGDLTVSGTMTGGGGGISMAHSALSGLANDDHTQYMHLSTARTVSALHDFTNGFKIGADITLNRKAADIAQLASGDSLQSATYTSGIAGWNIAADGSAEFSNVRVRGELASAVFKVNEIQATAGTFGVFKSASTTTQDCTLPALSGSFHLFIKTSDAAPTASLVAVNDVLRIKSWNGSAVTDSWMTVTAVSSAAGVTDATCTLNSGTASATIKAGTAVVDYGPTGSGFITLSADGAVGSSANMSIATHAGAPWTTQTLVARIGNLNGSYGIASDSYGLGFGNYTAGNYLRYDSTNGLILKGGGGKVNITDGGLVLLNDSSNYDSTGALRIQKSDGALIGYLFGRTYTTPATGRSLTLTTDDITANNNATLYLQAEGNAVATLSATDPTRGTTNFTVDSYSMQCYTNKQLASTIATGTAPLAVVSTTKVTNLNADSVDGFHATQSGAASSVVATDASGNLSIGPMWAYSFSGRYTYTCAKNSAALLAPGSGVFVVRGSIADNNFIDLVVHQSYSAGVVKVASSIYGTPPGRTYSDSGGSLYLTLDNTGTDGTYAIGVNVLLA